MPSCNIYPKLFPLIIYIPYTIWVSMKYLVNEKTSFHNNFKFSGMMLFLYSVLSSLFPLWFQIFIKRQLCINSNTSYLNFCSLLIVAPSGESISEP